MIYVMSDIHGCYDKYIEMLEQINFSESDTLYILGDVIDRGMKPVELLCHIQSNKNIIHIKGNHELMFQQYYQEKKTNTFDTSQIWFSNGGYRTYQAICSVPEDNYIDELYSYICELPVYDIVDINEKKYLLVHAGVFIPYKQEDLCLEEIIEMQDEDDFLWDKAFSHSDRAISNVTVICGHVPVQVIDNEMNTGNVEVRIIHKTGKILIDCGAVFDKNYGRLACLRLDDMKEFYI